jgi:hypothetical protein
MEPINTFPDPKIREGMKRLGIGWFRPTRIKKGTPVKETLYLPATRWNPVMTQAEQKEQQSEEIVRLLEEHGDNMSEWEYDFLQSIHEQLKQKTLSSKQVKILDDIGTKYI